MKLDQNISDIVSSDEAKKILLKYEVKEYHQITEDKEFIKYNPNTRRIPLLDDSDVLEDILSQNSEIEQSLPIAIAITAYARMYMNSVIREVHEAGGKIYYTDTDSIVTDIPLPDKYIGEGIGQFKLEHEVEYGIFAGPKMYYLKTKDGKEIKVSKGVKKEGW